MPRASGRVDTARHVHRAASARRATRIGAHRRRGTRARGSKGEAGAKAGVGSGVDRARPHGDNFFRQGGRVTETLGGADQPQRAATKWSREAAMAEVMAENPTVLLTFSTGKDSLACWLVLREYGFKVVPFYMAMVPGLQFVERSLRYYEDFFGTHIRRVLHPNLYWWLRTGGFQTPDRYDVIEDLNLPIFDYNDVNAGVARSAGLKEDNWCAVGTRVVDSPIRRMQLMKFGPLNYTQRTFMPVFDMKKGEMIERFRAARVRVSADYRVFGRSWDGLDYRYLAGIRKHYPEDYERILQWFPLAGLEFARARFGVKHGQAKSV